MSVKEWVGYLVNYSVLNTVQANELVEAMRKSGKTSEENFSELEWALMCGGYEFALLYAQMKKGENNPPINS